MKNFSHPAILFFPDRVNFFLTLKCNTFNIKEVIHFNLYFLIQNNRVLNSQAHIILCKFPFQIILLCLIMFEDSSISFSTL